ncbi:MAG: prepilin-type N-terminal cleavage/methylation domain-containing protein [Methylobacter sp.]|nr:MAG: prepilin-type N-terminal cleavage/methylation domain-containing protein [Methylobacter sp.]
MQSRTMLMMNNNRDSFTQGFSFIELLIVIAIIGVTLSIAVPSFQSLIASNRLTTSANSLVSALQLAKSEAIKSNRLVVVSNNGTWANGWVVFAEKNSLTNFDQDSDEPTISSFDPLNTGFTVNPTNVYANRVIYRPDGRSTANGSFYFCSPPDIADFRRVVIAPTGRVRVETPASSGIAYGPPNCPGNG